MIRTSAKRHLQERDYQLKIRKNNDQTSKLKYLRWERRTYILLLGPEWSTLITRFHIRYADRIFPFTLIIIINMSFWPTRSEIIDETYTYRTRNNLLRKRERDYSEEPYRLVYVYLYDLESSWISQSLELLEIEHSLCSFYKAVYSEIRS